MDLKIGQTKIVQAAAGALSYKDKSSKFPEEQDDLGYAALFTPTYKMKDGVYTQEKNLNAHFPYILDWKNDGWFRKMEGASKGYGLMIRDIKLVSQKTQPWAGDGVQTGGELHSVKVTFEPNNDGTTTPANETFLAKLYVHHSMDVNKVIAYIKQHMDNWVP